MPERRWRHRLYHWTANLLVLLTIAGLAWFFRGDVGQAAAAVIAQKYPCAQTITYHVARLDAGFGISEDELRQALDEAEALWEDALRRQLFERSTDDQGLAVSLIYDERQAATQKLAVTDEVIGRNQMSYDQLKAEHEARLTDYRQEQAAFAERQTAFATRENKLIDEVESWNERGGAPPEAYDRLTTEESAVAAEAEALNAQARQLNQDVANINDLVDRINRLAEELNLNVDRYNRIANERGPEFQEGQYRVGYGLTEIHVFEFASVDDLTRVLAHELGHALGLEHVNETGALMHYLNSGDTARLTEADLLAADQLCTAADRGGWRLVWLKWLAKWQSAEPVLTNFWHNIIADEKA